MSLYLEPLYESMVRQFTTTTSDGRFKEDFIAATNLVLDGLSNAGKLSSALSHVDATDDSIDDLDPEQSYLVNDGLILQLVNMGYKHVRGDAAFQAAMLQWVEACGDFMVMQSRELQADTDDDFGQPEEDVVGLGALDT